MQTKRSVVVLLLAWCALSSACDSGSDTGNSQNANDDGHGDGGRETVTLDDLIDASSGGHGDGGELPPPGDGGDHVSPMSGMDADVTPIDTDGSTPMLDADVPDDVPIVVPDDPSVRGPWPVGVRTAKLELGGGMAPAEIWYPAVRGSEAGQSQVVYDFIKWLPPEAQEDVPASDKPVPVKCNCYRDLPIDSAHGPYPVAVYVHNFGTFRAASSGLMEQWASRGFIVIALDHPRTNLQDVLAYASLGVCTGSGLTDDTTRTRDITTLLTMVRSPTEQFAFLAGVADATKIAVAGHADGGEFAAKSSGQAGVRLIMLWNNAIDVNKQGDLQAIAYFATSGDRTVTNGYTAIQGAYNDAPTPALFFGADRTGALSMTELCHAKSAQGRDGMTISIRYALCDLDYTILSVGWDCNATYLDQPTANTAFGLATTATLEQYLKGKDSSAAWATFNDRWGEAKQRL